MLRHQPGVEGKPTRILHLMELHFYGQLESPQLPDFGCRAASPGTMKLGGCENAALVQRLRRVEKTPVYSLMVALRREELSMPFDGASVANSPAIQWISRDTSKPGGSLPLSGRYS